MRLSGNPDPPLLNDMDDLPSPLGQPSCNPSPVAFPWKPFGAEKGGSLPLSDLLQSLQSHPKRIRFHIGHVPAFPEATQFFPKIGIGNACRLQVFRQMVSLKMGKAATCRKTPDIDGSLNVMFLKEGKEFLERPRARSQGKNERFRLRICWRKG